MRISAAVAMIGLVTLAGFSWPKQDAPPQGQETHKVVRGDLKVRLEFEGALVPLTTAAVACKLEAYSGELTVAEVVTHGRTIKKGDILIRLESKIEEQIEQTANALATAQTAADRAHEELKLAERGDRLALESSQRQAREAAKNLELFEKIDLPLGIKETDLGVQHVLDAIDDQREELDQLLKMYKSEELTNATAEIVVQRAKRTLERTQVQLEITKTRAAKTKEHEWPAQLEQHKAAAEEAAHNLDVLQKTSRYTRTEKENGLVHAQLELAQQRHAMEKLKADKGALTVRATMDGTVYYGAFDAGKWSGTAEAMKALKIGEKVQANQVLMSIVSPGVDVQVGVKESDLHLFTEGLKARVIPVGFPSLIWTGKSTAAAPIAGGEGTFDALIKLGVSENGIVAGMKAKVYVHVADLKGVLLLPVGAVVDEDGKKWVTLKGAEAPTEVKVGKSDGKLVEIVEGVREGDEVVPPKGS